MVALVVAARTASAGTAPGGCRAGAPPRGLRRPPDRLVGRRRSRPGRTVLSPAQGRPLPRPPSQSPALPSRARDL